MGSKRQFFTEQKQAKRENQQKKKSKNRGGNIDNERKQINGT